MRIWFLLFLLFPSLLLADSIFTTKSFIDKKVQPDPYGFSYRAGYLLEAPYEESSGDIINFSAEVKRPGCGVVGLIGDITSLFNAQQLEQGLASIAQSALYSLPLFLMSYASPTMADVYKHMRMWAQAIARWDMAQCEKVEEAAMKAGAYYGGIMDSRSACIREKIAEGKSLHDAVSECNKDSRLYNFVTGAPVKNYNLATIVADRLNIPKDTPMGQYLRAVLGDYSYESDRVEGNIHTAALESFLGKYEEKAREDISEVVKAFVREGYSGCEKVVRKLSADDQSTYAGRTVPFTCSAAAAVAALPAEEQPVAINAISETVALLSVYSRIMDMLQELYAIADEAAAKGHGQEAETIRKAVGRMKEEADVLWRRYLAQKEVAERILQTAYFSAATAKTIRQGTERTMRYHLPGSSPRTLFGAGER